VRRFLPARRGQGKEEPIDAASPGDKADRQGGAALFFPWVTNLLSRRVGVLASTGALGAFSRRNLLIYFIGGAAWTAAGRQDFSLSRASYRSTRD
jgi:hypothetical protein